jgi:hypothetical protein
MKHDRRSFLALLAAGVPAFIAACGATATATPRPVQGPPAPPAQGPRFSVDREEIDFGNVTFEKLVSAVFKVTNTGTAPLLLTVPSVVRAEEGC